MRAVHETGTHGGPPTKLVGTTVVLAFAFGSAVLIAEVLDSGDGMDHGEAHGPTIEHSTPRSTEGRGDRS